MVKDTAIRMRESVNNYRARRGKCILRPNFSNTAEWGSSESAANIGSLTLGNNEFGVYSDISAM